MSDRHLSPAEVVQRLGVSIRALRLYERKGLLSPQRTAAGWRVYGPQQMVRLHQILALKGLGLALSRIGALLADGAGLDAVLAVQEKALALQAVQADRALAAVRKARASLSRTPTLSLDELTILIQETKMTTPMTDEDMKTVMAPLWAKHLTPEEIGALADKKHWSPDAGRQWTDLIADAERVMAKGDPASDEAAEIVRRWKTLQDAFTGGDPDLTQRTAAIWTDAFADPGVAPRLPISKAVWDFIGEASRILQASQD